MFILKVDALFSVTEELAFNSRHRTATGKSSFKDVDKTIVWYNVKWNGLKQVIYDGGKCFWFGDLFS